MPAIERALIMLLLVTSAGVVARAQIPALFSYQGILTDSLGNPKPDGTYTFTFKLHEASSGGNPIWEEMKQLQVRQGLFSTVLGDATPFGPNVHFNIPYWLGVGVGSGPDLSPRIPLSPVALSLNSAKADSARISGTIADNSVMTTNIADEAVTLEKISSKGATSGEVLMFDGTKLAWRPLLMSESAPGGANVPAPQPFWRLTGNSGTDPSLNFLGTTDNATLRFRTNNVERMVISSVDGKVGIGTPAPGGKLDVAGDITANAPDAAFFVGPIGPTVSSIGFIGRTARWTGRGTNDNFLVGSYKPKLNFATNNDTLVRMTIDATGNVGIGTTSPAQLLDVAGTTQSLGFKMPTGAGLGRVLTSDAQGMGTWQNPAGSTAGWSLTGNSGTSSVTNFVGTTDTAALELRVQNERVLRLEPGFADNDPGPNVIGGSSSNRIEGVVKGSTIAGGGIRRQPNRVMASYATIGGGKFNISSGDAATVGGGDGNKAIDEFATVGGGLTNLASAFGATVGGGADNKARGRFSVVSGGGGMSLADSNVAFGDHSAIGGGKRNRTIGINSTVAGGDSNSAVGNFSTIPGGSRNRATGDYSLAAGRRAKASHNGSFIWGDATDADFASTADNQFLIRAFGGVGIGTNNPMGALHILNAVTPPTGLQPAPMGLLLGMESAAGYKWIQSYFGPLSLNPVGGNVGIGKNNPAQQLDVEGTTQTLGFRMPTGAGAGRVLTSDASGVGTWQIIDGGSGGTAWSLTGNTGTDPATNFLGTTDNTPLHFKVNDTRVLRLEPHPSSPNVIGGSSGNSVGSAVAGATIGGGGFAPFFPNSVKANFGTVGGGHGNTASLQATVSGGDRNIASGQGATVGGGQLNEAEGFLSTVGGGVQNIAGSTGATIAGGARNQATSNYATAGGGELNTASGPYAMVPGGQSNNAAGAYSFAAGLKAKAIHHGAFVWADSTGAEFTSTASNEFNVRASGGVKIFTSSDLSSGVALPAGSNAWGFASDSTVKRNIRLVDGKEIVEKIMRLPIKRWSYKSQDPSIEHIGPMAQDFYPLFGVGDDEKTLSTIDLSGIALAAIQELCKEHQEFRTQNDQLNKRLLELEAMVKFLMAERIKPGSEPIGE